MNNNDDEKKRLSRVDLYDSPEHKRARQHQKKEPLMDRIKGLAGKSTSTSQPAPGTRAALRKQESEQRADYTTPRSGNHLCKRRVP